MSAAAKLMATMAPTTIENPISVLTRSPVRRIRLLGERSGDLWWSRRLDD
jgi:hypothetical protein